MSGDRLEVNVTFDSARGYIASAPELRQPIVALSLASLRKRIENDCSGCLMGHSDVLLVLLSPRSSSERFGAGARPVHPIRVDGGMSAQRTLSKVKQTSLKP